MILIYHQDNKVASIWDKLEDKSIEVIHPSIVESLLAVAKMFPARWIIWCHTSQKNNLNHEDFAAIFHHQKIMASYNTSAIPYLPDSIGYVEESPFIKINESVPYPTWQMSSCIGGIHAEILNIVNAKDTTVGFDFFLNSIAKRHMPLGLFCYSDPRLVLDKKSKFTPPGATVYDLFRFVKEHFKAHWCLLLFVDLLIYTKNFPLLALLYSCFFRNKMKTSANLDHIVAQSSKTVIEHGTIDVIIPTIGRKKYLHDVLKDLAEQTIFPKNIIIVEQNTLPGSITELDYLTEDWPFAIKHVFTHQAGACNARNIALSKVESEMIFFADDDIRIESTLIEDTISIQKQYGVEAVMLSCLLLGQTNNYTTISQTTIFGSGCSFVKYHEIQMLRFDEKLEFGYGEDFEFGMQMRNSGVDIIYLPNPRIIHLKAPIGGFRTEQPSKWDQDVLQPKPSPTVMFVKLKNLTSQQLLGYKLVLFIKLHRLNFLAIPKYTKKWNKSIYWANYLKNNG